MYQGGSDSFIGPARSDPRWRTKPGASISRARSRSITDDVPMGVDAGRGRRSTSSCVMLVNDVSLRNLIPAELAKGFGFFQSKPASAFSPVAVTPDELGEAWSDGKLHLPLIVT